VEFQADAPAFLFLGQDALPQQVFHPLPLLREVTEENSILQGYGGLTGEDGEEGQLPGGKG